MSKLGELNEKILNLKSEVRNLTFVNRALLKTCSDVNDENLHGKIENEALKCEIDLLKGVLNETG